MPPKRHARISRQVAIDPHTAGLQLSRHARRSLHVFGPDAGAEAHFGVVGAGDDVGFGGPFEDGEDGAEGLFGDDAGGFGGGVDEGGGDEVAGLGFGGEGAAAGKGVLAGGLLVCLIESQG